MNITLESLQQEIAKYQEIIGKYRTNPEYVNPNCPLDTAIEIVDRLKRVLSEYQESMILFHEENPPIEEDFNPWSDRDRAI